MKTLAFTALAESKGVHEVLGAFSELAGMAIKLVPFDARPPGRLKAGRSSPFCRLIVSTAPGRFACGEFLTKLQRQLAQGTSACARRCFAGLTELAVPVRVCGTTEAILLSGEFLEHKPANGDFDRCLRRLQRQGIRLDRARARRAYARTAVTSPARIRAARRLLTILAQHLGEAASHSLLVRRAPDPRCVTCAKAFVEAHLVETVRTRDAAHEAHVTEGYFCRVFKAATGMTFSEYVARVRVEQAKELLANPALRVTDVAFAAGFQSIPHFNHTFKRHNGTSPKEYRARLKG